MAILVFIVENLLSYGWVSTGPHVYLDLAFGWLQLHRYADIRIMEHLDVPMLIVAVSVPILVTWIFSRALRHRTSRQPMPGARLAQYQAPK
jgi:hypothetical protein